MPHSAAGGRIARSYAWTVVALRYPIVLGLDRGAGRGARAAALAQRSSTAPLDDIVQSDAEALVAQERAMELFGSTIATDSIVVERNPRGLTPAAEAEADRRARPAQAAG